MKTALKPCEKCKGDGYIIIDFVRQKCPECKGKGYVSQELPSPKSIDENLDTFFR